ncbi:hypothetical protein OUZ56_011913 [Daphnia magna]|uniref:DUF4806 domain-containing protein n=1 Tax=Daphnia magna TaxID=35525 RepID=A0ABQ9Z1T7_9CRUS|nr:hypothetical protein OUZ56_011913 [Daphnia magna]
MSAQVSVSRVLLQQKQEIRELKLMMTNLLEKMDHLLISQNPNDNGRSRMASPGLKLPMETKEDLIKLDMELGDNEELKSAIGIALSLLGGKNVKDIIRTILRGLMSRQLRMQYVAAKPTREKTVFKQHNTLYRFIIELVRSCCTREQLPVHTEKDILKFASLVFTNSADEDGGVVERKKKTALKRAAVAKYLKKSRGWYP